MKNKVVPLPFPLKKQQCHNKGGSHTYSAGTNQPSFGLFLVAVNELTLLVEKVKKLNEIGTKNVITLPKTL